MTKILLIEDSEDILANLYEWLEPLGYDLDCARNGLAGLDLALNEDNDLIVLDLTLPGMDGIEICKTIRKKGNHTPVIMLTARDAEADRVRGLEAGADDYLVKPFSLRELEARIRAILRRGKNVKSDKNLTFADLELNLNSHTVLYKKQEIKLSPTGFRILAMLMQAAPDIVKKEVIEEKLWGDAIVAKNTLRMHIHELRQKLDTDPKNSLIETISHVGYRLVEK